MWYLKDCHGLLALVLLGFQLRHRLMIRDGHPDVDVPGHDCRPDACSS